MPLPYKASSTLEGQEGEEVRIGELAERSGVSAKTIRYYQDIGLLVAPERTASGYRDFDHSALDRLAFIRGAGSGRSDPRRDPRNPWPQRRRGNALWACPRAVENALGRARASHC